MKFCSGSYYILKEVQGMNPPISIALVFQSDSGMICGTITLGVTNQRSMRSQNKMAGFGSSLSIPLGKPER